MHKLVWDSDDAVIPIGGGLPVKRGEAFEVPEAVAVSLLEQGVAVDPDADDAPKKAAKSSKKGA